MLKKDLICLIVKNFFVFMVVLMAVSNNVRGQGNVGFGLNRPAIDIYEESIPGFYISTGIEFKNVKGALYFTHYPRSFEMRVSDRSIAGSLGYKIDLNKSKKLHVTPSLLVERRKLWNNSLGNGIFVIWTNSISAKLDVGYDISEKWTITSASSLGSGVKVGSSYSERVKVYPFLLSFGCEFNFKND